MKKIILSLLVLSVLLIPTVTQAYQFDTKCIINTNGNCYKVRKIMQVFCSKHHNDCNVSYYKHCINGYCTYDSSSFVIVGNTKDGNFIITRSLFSTQLQHQLVFMLKQNGYSNASTVNLTTAFVLYITPLQGKRPVGSSILITTQILNNMISSGNLKDFNELVNLFVKHFIKINK